MSSYNFWAGHFGMGLWCTRVIVPVFSTVPERMLVRLLDYMVAADGKRV